jgi:transposase
MLKIYINSQYEKIIKPLLVKAGLKRTSNKYHNRIYDDHVKFYFLLLKEKTKMSYRDLCEFIKSQMIHRNLCLKKVPHYTTLQKFLQRIGVDLFNKLVTNLYGKTENKGDVLAVDTTGIDIKNTSSHYVKRIGGIKKKYAKLSILLNTKNKSICDVYAEVSHKHDVKMLEEHLKKKELFYKIKCLVADKGYFSKEIYWNFRRDKIEYMVPLKTKEITSKLNEEKTKRRGKIISRIRELNFCDKTYHKRSLVESTNSSIKRRFGSFVNSVKKENIVKQVYLKAILYNLDRFKKEIKENVILIFKIFMDFYKAYIKIKFIY